MLISDDGDQFAFDKRELAVLTAMMARDDERGMAALWLHPGKAQAWATDGNRAVLVERELKPPKLSTTAEPVALPAATVHHAAKTAGTRDLVVIDVSGKRVAIDVRTPNRSAKIESFLQIEKETESKHAVTCRRHRGGPGSIERVFPRHHKRGGKGAAVMFNPALLGPVTLLGRVTDGEVWINIGGPLDPLTFAARVDGWTLWRMVVMPMKPRTAGGYPEKIPETSKPVAAKPTTSKPTRGRRRKAGKATPSEADPVLRAVV